MTRTFIKMVTDLSTRPSRLGRSVRHLGLLLPLLLLAVACEGSQLGNTLGESLEPDPRLVAEESQAADNEGSDNGAASGRAGSGQGRAGTSGNDEREQSAQDGDRDNSSASEATTGDASTESAAEADTTPAVVAGDYTDIGKAPEEIQPYLVDLLELELLEIRPPKAAPTPAAPSANSSSANSSNANAAGADGSSATNSTPPPAPAATPAADDEFRPNQVMTRREYARWLMAVNNRFYNRERTRKIRPGVSSSQPVFKDVPTTDEDFGAIQGLAEAGIIPSPLTGSSTTINFRPDAPLTRKDLLLWKVPLDLRQTLPEASVSAVQQAWGFQDAGKIDPRTLQAVLADYQNGDFANIRRAFSYTTLFQPDKAATRAEGAAVLWRFGNLTEGITAAEIRSPNQTDTPAAERPNRNRN